MKILFGEEEEKAKQFFNFSAKEALNSGCHRVKCASLIVKNNKIIGRGFNSPPKNDEGQRRCLNLKDFYHKKVTDKTCCIHAEQRAIFDALKNMSKEIEGSTLYFVRLDENNNIEKSGKPYCTICSKMALDVGIAEFVLWHDQGICVYETGEYNKLSFEFSQ